jgi:hypothetical protein
MEVHNREGSKDINVFGHGGVDRCPMLMKMKRPDGVDQVDFEDISIMQSEALRISEVCGTMKNPVQRGDERKEARAGTVG